MNTKAKILIVEDDVPMRFVIEYLLNAEGYDVSTAANGVVALELASRERFDLIMMDMIMPRMDGIETILSLRVSQPKTRIIAMSGGWSDGTRSYLSLAGKIGASQLLAKPFDREALLNAIKTELGKTDPLIF